MTEGQGPSGSKLDEIRQRRRRRTILRVLTVLLLVGAGVGAYLYFEPDLSRVREWLPFAGKSDEEGPAFGRPEAPATPEEEARAEMPEAEPEPAAGPEEVLEIELPPLDASDPAAREYAADLSDLPEYEDLLAVDELVRRFTVVVHNVAAGKSPRFHLPFLVPRKPFGAIATGGRLVSDPKSYARYDTIGNVFASLDAEKTVRLFRAFDPLVDQAHRDLGHQRNEFEATLRRAIVELLETPVLVGPVPVQLDVLTYVYADPQIENLDPVQKLFLRMGAANVQKVQGKLREIAAALGIPEDDLPRERRLRPAG